MKLTSEELADDLNRFTGTETYTKYMFGLKLTDGVVYLAKEAGAFWLIDIVASILTVKKVQAEEFVSITLTKNKTGNGAKFTATDGNDKVLYVQNIQFTDFPLSEIKLFLVDRVLMLVGEY